MNGSGEDGERLAVAARPDSPRAHSLNSPQFDRLAPGDIIRGRVLRVSPDGQTLLQIGPHQVRSDQPLGGRPGDTLWFEVLPSLAKNGDFQKTRAPLLLRLLANESGAPQTAERAPQGITAHLKLPPSGRVAAQASATPAPAEGQERVPGPVLLVTNALQLVETMRALSRKWIHPARRRLAKATRRDTAAARIKPQPGFDAWAASSERAPAGVEKTISRAVDSSWDDVAALKIDAGHHEGGKVRINVQAPDDGASKSEKGRTLTASVILDLEKTGRIEVDVQMNAHLIRVLFKVDTDALGEAIQSEIGRVRTALNHLVAEVYCRVQIDKQPNKGSDRLDPVALTAKTGIDYMI